MFLVIWASIGLLIGAILVYQDVKNGVSYTLNNALFVVLISSFLGLFMIVTYILINFGEFVIFKGKK